MVPQNKKSKIFIFVILEILILDLDETLLHSEDYKIGQRYDKIVEFRIEGEDKKPIIEVSKILIFRKSEFL